MSANLISLFGLFVMMLIAWLLSNNKQQINWRVIFGGLFLQFILALFVLNTKAGQQFFIVTKDVINSVIELSDTGALFMFGQNFKEHFFAFKVLPTIIFISALSYLFFYWGFIQRIIEAIAWMMKKTMNISATEGFVTAANIFCGQTEAPLFVKPYLATMTRSEINTMMTAGMSTVAGGVLAAYVGLGISAGHLVAASLMSAPAAILISKLMFPEIEESKTSGKVSISFDIKESNGFEAACSGASQGLKLALNVGAMLITFIALVALVNMSLKYLGSFIGVRITLEEIFGYLFQPLAWIMGISWDESFVIGQLLGEKMVTNEFVAYIHLSEHIKAGTLSDRTVTIATYALCGFANFSSIAVQIGGIGALEPTRKADFAKCGMYAMIGGTLASFMTACIAGFLY